MSQFVLGGLDTTSNAMAMVAYEVAKRPDVQAKIRAELTASLAKYGGQWTYEMIRDLKYLHSVLNGKMHYAVTSNYPFYSKYPGGTSELFRY